MDYNNVLFNNEEHIKVFLYAIFTVIPSECSCSPMYNVGLSLSCMTN